VFEGHLVRVPRIKGKAVLIGYDAEGQYVYSEILDILDYYNGEHVWDSAKTVKKLRLQRVRGFLFTSSGTLDQEFESEFDLETGVYKAGRVRYADGTVHDSRADT
jgi:hypothetical protein